MTDFFKIAELNERLQKTQDSNRHDIVSGLMRDIFQTRADKNPNEVVTAADFKSTFSKVANLNKQSDFRFHFSDVFEGKTPIEKTDIGETVGATSRLAGFDEDFRPTPTEIVTSDAEQIKKASLKAISSVLEGLVDSPQYHFNEFVEIAGYGKNSGFASWTVAFKTGKGMAKINVPTPVIDGVVESPSVFYASAGKAINFDKDGISKFARSFIGTVKNAINESGVETLGGTTLITDHQNLQEAPSPSMDINFGLGTIVNEDSGAVISSSYDKKKLLAAIDVARKYVEGKIGSGLELKFAAGSETEDKKHIIAFNITKNTVDGLKVATIPVEVDGLTCAADSFYDNSQQSYALESDKINSYLSSSSAKFDGAEVEAFTDSFLTTDASFKQLQEELKFAAFANKNDRAKSVLYAIANRFGDESFENAANDFQNWSLEAKEVKAGKKEKPKDVVEREAAFGGVLKTSSIIFN